MAKNKSSMKSEIMTLVRIIHQQEKEIKRNKSKKRYWIKKYHSNLNKMSYLIRKADLYDGEGSMYDAKNARISELHTMLKAQESKFDAMVEKKSEEYSALLDSIDS